MGVGVGVGGMERDGAGRRCLLGGLLLGDLGAGGVLQHLRVQLPWQRAIHSCDSKGSRTA